MKNGPRLSSALAPHRILTNVPAMDQFELIFHLFEAIRPDYSGCLDLWEDARRLTVTFECALPEYFGGGLGFLQPIGNAGAPGPDWLAAVACSPEGIRYEALRGGPERAHLVVLTLNPPQPRGAYLLRIRAISLLTRHARVLGEAVSSSELLELLEGIEGACSGET